MLSARILWLFGLPSSGKSTLATALREHFASKGKSVICLDGDDLRSGVCSDLGFSDDDRSENLRRAAEIAKILAEQGAMVICSFVTPKNHHRDLVQRLLATDVRFVHVNCPLDICIQRDVKGLYAAAAARKIEAMTGVQQGFDPPAAVGITVETHMQSVGECVDAILQSFHG